MKGLWEHMKFVLAVCLVIGLLKSCMSIHAAELPDPTAASTEIVTTETEQTTESEQTTETELTTESEVLDDVLDDQEVRQTIEYSLELNQPIETFTITPVPVYEVNPDDYNGSMISTFAINADVYNGSYNSTVITLWNGLLSNNIGKDYAAYRASQYEYYIWFGEDFEASGNTFTGSGTYYCLNTYGSTYYLTTGSDSFTVDAGQNYLYTNVSAGYPALETERGLLYEQIQTVLLTALLFFGVFKWIFTGR